VRDGDDDIWVCNFFSYYLYDGGECKFGGIDCEYDQCIPYEGNEHLVGTKNKPE